ncbi:MAG: radical SAM protein [Acidobacteria bacterium]|nr:radical SAM protein [Acidobacteriota bacterium]
MPSERRQLLKGMIRYYPFVLKNFRTYLSNLYIRRIRKSNIVKPYSAVFYATHKCNLDCSYCTQKNPEVFSEELDTAKTIRVLDAIRRGVDTILFTGGEPLIRPDIEELVRAARREAKFLDVLLVTNGVLLPQRPSLLDHLTGLIVSLDAITPDSSRSLSKSSVVEKVLDNLRQVRAVWPPRSVTISCVLEEWNISEAERILDFCIEQGFFFSLQSAQDGLYPNYSLLHSPRYRAFVDRLVRLRAERKASINGSPRLLRTLLEFGEFHCYPTMFPRVYPNGDVFYPCEPLRKIAGNLLEEGSFEKIFERGRRLYGDIPTCRSICYLFGNVLSSYYVEDFWGLAADTIRR